MATNRPAKPGLRPAAAKRKLSKGKLALALLGGVAAGVLYVRTAGAAAAAPTVTTSRNPWPFVVAAIAIAAVAYFLWRKKRAALEIASDAVSLADNSDHSKRAAAPRASAPKGRAKSPDLTCSRLPIEHQQAVLQFHQRVAPVAEDLQALFVGALLDGDKTRARQQLTTLAPILGMPVASRIPQLFKDLNALDPIARLPLLELLRPQLAALPEATRNNLTRVARAFFSKIEPLDAFRFACVRLMLRVLSPAPAPAAVAANATPPSLEGYAAEASLICSLMAQCTKGRKEQAYYAGVESLLSPRFQAEFIATPISGKDADAAMLKLATLAHAQRAMISAALVRITGGKGDLSAAEMDLLRALCAGIVTPMPGTGAVRLDPADLLAPRRATAAR
jgi:hypothetical protein